MSDTAFGHARPADHYEIRLVGHLHPRWADRFDGMALTAETDGTNAHPRTRCRPGGAARAAAHLRDLGLPLLSVTRLDPTTDNQRTST
jgi:hypothetical protein